MNIRTPNLTYLKPQISKNQEVIFLFLLKVSKTGLTLSCEFQLKIAKYLSVSDFSIAFEN